MDADRAERLRAVGAHFEIPGVFLEARRHGTGHIHDTFVGVYDAGGRRARYVHQRLNTRVFRDPDAVMDNVARVTAHLERRGRRALRIVPTRGGSLLHRDAEGRPWRTYAFVEGTRSHDLVRDASQAFAAARAFGEFAAHLADLPPPPLAETIPRFHDLPARAAALEAAARRDPCARAAACGADLDAARRHLAWVERELGPRALAGLPQRPVHHDCKLNNLLFDVGSDEPVCVIDLDTVMPGSLLSDFGELVRTATCPAPEDARDLDAVVFDVGLFRALARGYLAGTGPLLAPEERDGLAVAGVVFALMNGVRFLADHLEGDVYFQTHRPGHNLDRARAQLRLVERMLASLPEARAAVAEAARG